MTTGTAAVKVSEKSRRTNLRLGEDLFVALEDEVIRRKRAGDRGASKDSLAREALRLFLSEAQKKNVENITEPQVLVTTEASQYTGTTPLLIELSMQLAEETGVSAAVKFLQAGLELARGEATEERDRDVGTPFHAIEEIPDLVIRREDVLEKQGSPGKKPGDHKKAG